MAFMTAAAPIMGAVGAGVSALGAITGGIAQGQEASYQAQVARNNAQIAQQNAGYATAAGSQQAEATSLEGAEKSGQLKAAQGANNIDVNSGSAVAAQVSEREANQLNTETMMNNALLNAYGYKSQATGFTAQSGLEETEAKEAPIAGVIGGTGSLLSNASTVGFKYGGLGPSTANLGPSDFSG